LRGLLKGTTGADKVLLSVLVLLSLSGIIFIQEVLPKGKTVHIEVEGRPLYVLPIEKDRMLTVDGPQGKTIIEIKQQKLRVKDSPCPKKQCVKHGWIERGIIVCLPNKVVITIGNESDEDNTVVDAITR
jgi:hypothetical protein